MSRPMVAVKEASWSTQSGVLECGYHDRKRSGNGRCPTQEESRYSVCTGGKMERIESEECGPWLQTFFIMETRAIEMVRDNPTRRMNNVYPGDKPNKRQDNTPINWHAQIQRRGNNDHICLRTTTRTPRVGKRPILRAIGDSDQTGRDGDYWW